MHRFFILPEGIKGGKVRIEGGAARQIYRVLRLRRGDAIVVLDNSGWEYQVALTEVRSEWAEGGIQSKRMASGEPAIRVTLYQGLLKGEKFELVLQKSTELGVAAFVPVICQRSVAREGDKQARWERVIREASEQCRRGKLPVLHPPTPFEQSCHTAQGPSLMPWEGEESLGLRSALSRLGMDGVSAKKPFTLNLFIGPEGGFSPEEAECARSQGILTVSLGERILRAETAAIVAASAIFYHLGELGG